jgi:hypothetical protein
MDSHETTLAVAAGEWNVAPVLRQPPIDDTVLNGEILGSGIALRDTPTLLEEQKLQAVLSLYPQETLEPKHHFAPGMYGRELFMKAGTLIVGKIHKHEHLAIMVYGDITVYSPKEGKKRLKGHHIMVSPAETKRVVYPHADTLWITVHASDSRDLEQLEKELITPEDPALIEELAREYLASLPEIAA